MAQNEIRIRKDLEQDVIAHDLAGAQQELTNDIPEPPQEICLASQTESSKENTHGIDTPTNQ